MLLLFMLPISDAQVFSDALIGKKNPFFSQFPTFCTHFIVLARVLSKSEEFF